MTWQKIKFGDHIEIILGGTPSTTNNEFWGGNIPWVSVVDFIETKRIYITEKTITELGLEKSNTKLLKTGDIILSARGTVGKIVVCGTPMAFNQSCYALRSINEERLSQNFLYYLTKTVIAQLKQQALGGVFDTIIKKTIDEVTAILPPLDTQFKIASILSAYDDLIENNLNRIKLLEEKALIEYNFTKKELKDSRNDKKKLKEVLDFKYGKSLKADNRTGGEYPVYGSSGIVGYHETFLIAGPGIVVGRKGNVGSVYWSFDNFWVIDTAYFITSNISLYYLYFNLKEQHFVNTDAAVPGLNRNFALDNPIPLPPKNKIIEFEDNIKPVFNLIHNLQKQNIKLREARDILLPKLMSGEIGV